MLSLKFESLMVDVRERKRPELFCALHGNAVYQGRKPKTKIQIPRLNIVEVPLRDWATTCQLTSKASSPR